MSQPKSLFLEQLETRDAPASVAPAAANITPSQFAAAVPAIVGIQQDVAKVMTLSQVAESAFVQVYQLAQGSMTPAQAVNLGLQLLSINQMRNELQVLDQAFVSYAQLPLDQMIAFAPFIQPWLDGVEAQFSAV